jgi:hypothetical protein
VSNQYEVTWTKAFETPITIHVKADSPEDAADEMFRLTNAPWAYEPGTPLHAAVQQFEASGQRSLSVGDRVVVDGVEYACMSQGWELATEAHASSMEARWFIISEGTSFDYEPGDEGFGL